MKCLPFLETSLTHHQMVIRDGICLGFDNAKGKFPNMWTHIPVRNRKFVKIWREQLKNCIRIHNYSFSSKLCRMSAIILNCTFHTRIFPLSMSKNSKDLIMLWMNIESIKYLNFSFGIGLLQLIKNISYQKYQMREPTNIGHNFRKWNSSKIGVMHNFQK